MVDLTTAALLRGAGSRILGLNSVTIRHYLRRFSSHAHITTSAAYKSHHTTNTLLLFAIPHPCVWIGSQNDHTSTIHQRHGSC